MSINNSNQTILPLSDASQYLAGQPMFHILNKIKELEKVGKDIVHFEIGDPDFDTPANIVDAACDALKSGKSHYESSWGLFDLRQTIQQITLTNKKFLPDIENILITPGANMIIYYALRCLLNPGDDLILPDPCFPTYLSASAFCQVNPIMIPLQEENQFCLKAADIEKRITPKTKLIIINSPHNPCGAVMSQREIDDVYDLAEAKNIYLLSDEIYSRMIYNDVNTFYSPAIRDKNKVRTIVIDGFSKAFAMTGWRLGFAMGPQHVMQKMQLLLETTSSCVSPFIQYAGCEALVGDQAPIHHMMNTYKERRDIIVESLNTLPNVSCNKPGGAFYVFPNITKTGLSDVEFCDIMLNEVGVAMVPGSSFGPSGSEHVRLCYANSKEHIIEGMSRMKKYLSER